MDQATLALSRLRTDPRFAAHIAAWRRLPARPATHADAWPPVDPRLVAALGKRGIDRLYTHQAVAVEAALAGQHIVVVTPTASGKTLCYNLPVLHTLLQDPSARALYLFPTKALAQDQLAELHAWSPVLGHPVRAATYDGDTPTSARPATRRDARIVVTNPDMLHTGILPHHTRWADFFSNLCYVVVDEMHVYRGIFGSHVANVFRRLRRVCRFYGSAPQFILSSATIANPEELARHLVEADVTLVDGDGAPRGERHFLFYNPPVVDRTLGIRRSAVLEAEALARQCLAHDIQTIVFTRARLTTELLLRYLHLENPKSQIPNPKSVVRGYRGGYLPAERREIERGLREGTVRAVVATNALDLGIDIGQLDVSIMAGYPGTVASTWQQAGRAGRRASVSVSILVAGGNPLDQYIVTHPDYFFGRSPEHALVNPDNLLILLAHLQCAAFELPFQAGESFGCEQPEISEPDFDHGSRRAHNPPGRRVRDSAGAGGEMQAEVPGGSALTAELLDYLAESGVLHRVGDTWYWLGDSYPAERVSLRSAGPDQVAITVTSGETPQTIGTVDRMSAPLQVPTGAVYLHDGQAYHVDRLDWEAGQALVRSVEVDYYTDASFSVEVRPVATRAEERRAGATVAYGEVQLRGRATGYKKVRLYTHETLGWGEIDLPEQTTETAAYWFILAEEVVERLRAAGWWRFDPIGYRGPNWQAQRDKARARDGYRCRHCSAPERPDRQHDIHHVRPFRDFGYVPGQNDHYQAANQLENLITLCRDCHRRAEGAQRFQGALTGLGSVLGHVAPLYLMCDYRDIGILAEAQAAWSKAPTVTIYEKIPAGVGFSETLFRLHDQVLGTAEELIRDCGCERGCPSCVGPVEEVGEDARAYTLAILAELR